MSRLSIVIPWRESTAAFETTLESVLASRPADSEIIVVHRGDYDDPYELGREVLFVEHDEGATVSALVNRGLEVACGEVVHLIGCGVTVHEGWADGVRERFASTSNLGAVTPVLLQASSPSRLVNAGVKLGATGPKWVARNASVKRVSADAWGPSFLAAFYRRDALRSLGGVDESVGAQYDIDIAGCLRQLEYKMTTDVACQLKYDATVQRETEAANQADYSDEQRQAQRERIFWRHRPLLGSGSTMLHGTHAAASALWSLCRGNGIAGAMSRLGAACEWSAYRNFRQQLASTADEGAETLSIERERERRSRGSHRRAA